MCGHGTIGLVVTLAHLGRIQPGEHRIETPVGIVTATLHADGEVSVDERAELSRGERRDRGRAGHRPRDRRRRVGRQLVLPRRATRPDARRWPTWSSSTDFTWRIRQAVNAAGVSRKWITSNSSARRQTAGAHSRNFVLCPGKAYDRSPCGTGTSAKLACLAADGKLGRGRGLGAGEHHRQPLHRPLSLARPARPADRARPSPARPS